MLTLTRTAGHLCGIRIALLSALIAIFGLTCTAQAASHILTLYFDKGDYTGDVWLTIQDPNANATGDSVDARYGANFSESMDFSRPDNQYNYLMSKPVKISEFDPGGLQIHNSDGAVYFLYFDDPTGMDQTQAPAYITSKLRFQPFELTMVGGTGNQGNLTAINYFTAPMSITSYENDPIQNTSEPVLQQTGYTLTTPQIAQRFNALIDTGSTAVVKDDNKHIIRYIGPSSFTSNNPWPSFVNYMKAVNQDNQVTSIINQNGFHFAPPNDTPVYQFGCDMNATVDATGTITATGRITRSTDATDPIPPPHGWLDATITISTSNVDDFNTAIYGQVTSGAVTLSGTAWSSFESYTKGIVDPGGSDTLFDQGAYNTTVAMIIGEISTTILGGFMDSDYASNEGPALKDIPSYKLWKQSPIVAFSEVQPNYPYYNVYANVIFNSSNNTVYGVPYSDRFGTGPLVDCVQHDTTPVGYWVIGIGDPLPASFGITGALEAILLDD